MKQLSICVCTRAINRSSHASYRSRLTLTSIAYKRDGQSERRVLPAPIRAPWRSSHLSGQKKTSIHTAARHALTRTPLRHIVQEAVFSLINFPASFIRLWPSCNFDSRGSRHAWGTSNSFLSQKKTCGRALRGEKLSVTCFRLYRRVLL